MREPLDPKPDEDYDPDTCDVEECDRPSDPENKVEAHMDPEYFPEELHEAVTQLDFEFTFCDDCFAELRASTEGFTVGTTDEDLILPLEDDENA